MLVIKDASSNEEFEFLLNDLIEEGNTTFILTSENYPGFTLKFKIEYPRSSIPGGYSVSPYIFANKHYAQGDVIDLRINDIDVPKGRVGYFCKLDAIFEPSILNMSDHLYAYIYLSLVTIFSSNKRYQQKDVFIEQDHFAITDFFDENSILLMLCDQHTKKIESFEPNRIMASLFLKGFNWYEKVRNFNFNDSIFLQENFNAIKSDRTSEGYFVLRISLSSSSLVTDPFVKHLFFKLINSKIEPTTRFIMLYQIIEICIHKILKAEIREKVCINIDTIDNIKLRDLLTEVQKESKRIGLLLNKYARPSTNIETEIKNYIIDFFSYIEVEGYLDPEETVKLTLATVFYDLRNKLVHAYRIIHKPTIDHNTVILKLQEINKLIEILIAEIVENFELTE